MANRVESVLGLVRLIIVPACDQSRLCDETIGDLETLCW